MGLDNKATNAVEVGVSSSPDSDLQSGCNVSSGGRAGAGGCRGWRGNGLCLSLSFSECLSALLAEHVLQIVSNKLNLTIILGLLADTHQLCEKI